jgi:hypothetical protein
MDKKTKEMMADLCELVADYLDLRILEHKHWEARRKAMEDYPVLHFREDLARFRESARGPNEDSKEEARPEIDEAFVQDLKRRNADHSQRMQRLDAEERERFRKREALLGRIRDRIRQLGAHLTR